jgi:hypothetical protein
MVVVFECRDLFFFREERNRTEVLGTMCRRRDYALDPVTPKCGSAMDEILY